MVKSRVVKYVIATFVAVLFAFGVVVPSAASVQVHTQQKKLTCTSSSGPTVVIRGVQRGSVDHRLGDFSYSRYVGNSSNYWTSTSRTYKGGTHWAHVIARYNGNQAILNNSSYCSTA